MPLSSFRTGERSSASAPCELADRGEAWKLTRVCTDLIRRACRNLKQNSVWRIKLLHDAVAPLARIRLVVTTLTCRLPGRLLPPSPASRTFRGEILI
jgi:hypothetical protein